MKEESQLSEVSVGIDLGVTAQHEAYILGPAGKKTFRFFTTVDEIDALVNLARSTAEHPEDKIIFVLEPTGRSWIAISRILKAQGYDVYMVNAKRVKHYRSYLNGKRKTDKLDAKVLAAMGRDYEVLTPVVIPREEVMVLQILTRERVRLQELATSEKKRIKALCHEILPGLPSLLGDNFYHKAWRPFLSKFINPFDIMRAGPEGISDFLARHDAKSDDLKLVPSVLNLASEVCKLHGIENKMYFQAIALTMGNYLDILDTCESKVEEHDKLIAVNYPAAHPSRVVETVPGVGRILAPVLIACTGDPDRFSSLKKYKGYSGFIPEVSESGERAALGLRMTKQGPNHLKRALYLAADRARRWDIELARIYYKAMTEKGHCHAQAVCVVANNLAGRILTILKEDRPYVIRGPKGAPISRTEANQYILKHLTVPEHIRQRKRSRNIAKKERLLNPHTRQSKTPQVSANRLSGQ